MKKIIIFKVLLLGIQLNSFAQGIDEKRTKIHHEIEDETILKEIDNHINPNGETRNSLVLSKNTLYKFYTYINDPADIKITLYDEHENIMFHNKSTDQGVVSFSLKCNKTAVYHLFINNLTTQELSNVIVLTFAGIFEPKDLSKITPEVTNSETIVNTNNPLSDEEEVKEVFFKVEKMPQFKDKESKVQSFKDYIKHELHYPQEALNENIEGIVYVQFTVNKDGYVKDAKIARGKHPALNQEALRIIYSSPKWEPGIQRDKPVDVVLTYPVVFNLP